MEPTNNVDIRFDQPLSSDTALKDDKLERRRYAEAAVEALRRIGSFAGLVISVEGAWGSGKTSVLAMIEALLRAEQAKPVIVHFNPWLVGDRDALLRHFLSKIAAAVKLADHAENGKKVARELNAYAKVFDFIKLVPGAEPWASLVKSVIESAGQSVDSVATYKTPDIEVKKGKVEAALRKYKHPIIVFIDDIDRLFPLEVFEMVRIVKAVGDLPNVGYVLAWDPAYVSDALGAVNVPRAEHYLDKVVQVRLPLPAISYEARHVLINEALERLSGEAQKVHFPNSENRLGELYFSGLREMLEQPRDFARVFNTVGVIEPMLRGEIVLADIIGLAALMVKAPSVYELLRKEPRWFVGWLPGEHGYTKKNNELLKEGSAERDAAFDKCGMPNAVRALAHRLFPATARADDAFAFDRVIDTEGRIAAPARLLVALQLHVSGNDVSLVLARRYLLHPDQRDDIVGTLTEHNCSEFLECLGDVADSTTACGIADVERLSVDIARLADRQAFLTKSRGQQGAFRLSVEDVAVRAITLVVRAVAPGQGAVIAERIVEDAQAQTVAMELFARSYLRENDNDKDLRCVPEAKERLTDRLAKNVLDAAKAGNLLATCNPGFLLWNLSRIANGVCPKVLKALRSVEPSLDGFAMAIFGSRFDSTKGQIYSLPEDRSLVEAYCGLDELKVHAKKRLADETLTYPARAAWQSVVEEKSIYGIDGSYWRH